MESVFTAATSRKIPVYSVNNDGSGDIALTINCAWGASDIPEILDILDKYNVKCTFFVVGIWAEKNPDKLKMIADRGHEIGNHSYSHKLPSQSSTEKIEEEILKCNEIIKAQTGKSPLFYRAPSGDYNNETVDLAEKHGMTAIQWSVDSLDWMKDKSAQEITARVTGKITSGSIILFHNDTEYTVKVLPEVIEHLQKEHYTFVPVSELMLPGKTYVDSQGVQQLES